MRTVHVQRLAGVPRPVVGGLLVAAVLGAVTGCADGPAPTTAPTASTGTRPPLEVELPSSGYPDHIEVYLQALFEGQLRATADGCLYAVSGPGEGGPELAVSLFWPEGWTARERTDGEFEVLDESGVPRLMTGRWFEVAGGNTFEDSPAACVDGPMGQFSMHDEPRGTRQPGGR